MKFVLSVFLFQLSAFAATGSWNGIAFTAWNGVVQTSWNGTGVSCAGGVFVPTDISGIKLWLFANNLSLATGITVTNWPDQSGLSNNMVQSGTESPIFVTNIVNGKSIVRFNHTLSQWMVSTNNIGLSGDFSSTIFLVMSPASSTRSECYIGFGVSGGDSDFCLLGSTINSGKYSMAFGGGDFYNDTTSTTATFHLICVKKSSGAENTTTFIYKNGVVGSDNGGSDTATPNLTAAPAVIGRLVNVGTLYSDMDLAEVVVYDTALSDSNRILVQNYLASKYGL